MTCPVTEWLLGMQTCFSLVAFADRPLGRAYVYMLLGKAHLESVCRLAFLFRERVGLSESANQTDYELTNQGIQLIAVRCRMSVDTEAEFWQLRSSRSRERYICLTTALFFCAFRRILAGCLSRGSQ
jgi:hypothetical protein